MHQKPGPSASCWKNTGSSRRRSANISWGTRSTKLSWSARSTSSRRRSAAMPMVLPRLEVVEVLLELPLGHVGPVALELEALDGDEGVDELAPHRVRDDVVGLQGVERVVQGRGQRRAGAVLGRGVGVAGERLAGVEPAPHPV